MSIRNIILILLVGSAALACNPVKKVLKSDTMTRQVVDSFIKKNPYTNDTLITYIKGKTDTLIQHQSFRDTITGEAVPCDSFTRVTEKGTKVTVDKKGKLTIESDSIKVFIPIRVDTLNTLIKDRELLRECQDLVRRQDALLYSKTEQISQLSKENRKLNAQIFSIIGLIIATIVILVFLRMKR
jgi:hypothetical protein